ncbi:MAG: ribonuclease Z [Planctomycetota bacterium]|jgi:ribonuclease Z
MTQRLFDPHLVNGPAGDPALYVELVGQGRSLLFDLGRIDRLKPAELLRISHIFVSHTHFDHFVGFDHLLRLRLGQEKPLALFGPPGFLRNVEGKLAGYTWNLVEGQPFVLKATEVHEDRTVAQTYRCRDAFLSKSSPGQGTAPEGVILEDTILLVRAVALDHRIPSLAFAAVERDRVNVDPDALQTLGEPPGEWVGDLKQAVDEGKPPDTPIRVGDRFVALGELKSKLIRQTPGEKIVYVADAGYHPQNADKIQRLAMGANHLFCEGGFLHEDAQKAHDHYHLTAWEAGHLARQARVKRLTTFHFSPKYLEREDELTEEAQRAFRGEGMSSLESGME